VPITERDEGKIVKTILWGVAPRALAVGLVITCAAGLFGGGVMAKPGVTCDRAAIQASREFDVPLDVLRAVTRTETGRGKNGTLQPWPWTVNMEGAGHWFDTEDAALAFVFRNFKRGARSFDVGCFQINYKWHGQAFQSIEEMFDPVKNARYAAQFLSELYREMGTWTDAAGAYHSRTPKYAKIYKARFDSIHSQLTPLEVALAPGAPTPQRANGFPLLTGAGASGRRGSLVPLGGASRRSLFAAGGGDNG
jgi:hypothetical protein